MSSSYPSTDKIEQLPLKDLEENLEELLSRCRKLRKSATQKSKG